MALTRVEKERITDSRLKVQSVSNSLKQLNPSKIPDFEEIEECLENADKSLWRALHSSPPNIGPDTGSTSRE
jgi:hypothetical protein